MASGLARDEGPMHADPLAVSNHGMLPLDLLYEVLLRLPAKALCCLRLVCRSWRSLTSDPCFTRAHSARHPVFVALQNRHDEIHIVDLSGNIIKRFCGNGDLCLHMSLQAGLVYVSTVTTGDINDVPIRLDEQDLVLNPATGAISILPDGNRSPLAATCILGRVPSTGEYKVFRLNRYNMGQGFIDVACEVIALGGSDQRWRTKPRPIDISVDFRDMAAVHGVVYFWVGESSADDDSCSMVPKIALFDLATEEWRPTALRGPLSRHISNAKENVVYYEQDVDHIQFGSLDGCLVISHHKKRDCSTDLWFMTDMDNRLWTKRYSMPCMPHWGHRHACPPYPLVVLDDGDIVVWLKSHFVLRSYDPRTRAWADLATLEDYFAIGMHQGSLLGSDL